MTQLSLVFFSNSFYLIIYLIMDFLCLSTISTNEPIKLNNELIIL